MDVRRSEQIAEALEQSVFAGDYPDGTRLDELRLAESFCVSRTPIREALQMLVASGLAEQIPRRGVFVRQPGPVELMEMFETMAELEAACARLAATRMTDAMLTDLTQANDTCRAAVAASDYAHYYSANERFHQILYHGTANSFLEQQALRLQNRLKPYRKIQLRFRGRMAESLSEHQQIVDALQSAQPDRAAAVLRKHVAVQGEKFHQLKASLGQ